MANVSVQVTSTGDAIVTVTSDTIEGASGDLESLWKDGYMSAIKAVAARFKAAPLAGVEAVQAVIPGAEVISDEPLPQGTVPAKPAPALRV
jgi:hypothetical protein